MKNAEQIIAKILKDSRFHDAVAKIVDKLFQEYANDANASTKEPASEPEKKQNRQRQKTFDGLSARALRLAYRYRKKHDKPIEPELHAALIAKCPQYNPEDMTMFHGGTTEAATKRAQMLPSNLTNRSLKNKYQKQKRDGCISPEIQAEMDKRFPEYGKHGGRGTAPRPLSEISPASLLQRYYQMKRTGNITPEMDAAMAATFPDEYDVTNHLYSKRLNDIKKEKTTDMPPAQKFASKPAPTPKPTATPKPVTRIKPLPKQTQSDEPSADDIMNAMRGLDIVMPVERPRPTPKKMVISDPELTVTIEHGKKGNDVFVNGMRILHNHQGTRLQTFLNGEYLGVYGTPTDIAKFPDVPSWQIYNTNLTPRTFEIDSMTGKSIYIKSVAEGTNGQLVLRVSKRGLQYMLSALNTGRKFIIPDDQKMR